MSALTVRSRADRPDGPRRTEEAPCGGAAVLDLALCLILAVTVVGLLLLAL